MNTAPPRPLEADRLMQKLGKSAASGLPDDGTRQLLQGGGWTLATGLVSALCIRLFFGGIGEHGPHTNMGWLLLIVAMMCLPFGSLLSLLGAAKWLRNRRLSAR